MKIVPEAELGARLREGLEASGVPGAVLGVRSGRETRIVAAGVVNTLTGVPVTRDSIFQIGSITKSFTATLTMMLAEEGLLELDQPIIRYLPDFRLSKADVAHTITLRNLLCHTSGIDGDHIHDTGRGDDCIARLVALAQDADLIHPVGAFFSYCNVGYNILGRIIEVVTGEPWETVLREKLLRPLGLQRAATMAEEAIFFNTAVGHVRDAGSGTLKQAEKAFSPRSNGPSGTLLGMSAADLLTFAGFHMDGGVNSRGRRLLGEESVAAMRAIEVEIPQSYRYSSWGLGWMQFFWNGSDVFGHDGGWMGISAYLRISRSRDFAAVMFANGPDSAALYRAVFDPLVREGTGCLPPPLPTPSGGAGLDLSAYCGRYSRYGQFVEITRDGDTLRGAYKDDIAGAEAQDAEIRFADRRTVVCGISGNSTPLGGYFLDFDELGRPRYFHIMARAFRRQA